ncbi:MAG: DUF4838 domain-containing protein [Bacteroidetes bacterium]|nr:DUF4838 domain-containing protein [Bacteroidota bacterium]
MKKLFILIFLNCFCSLVQASAHVLATNGVAQYDIVISTMATEDEVHALHVLENYLLQITGAKFNVINENDAGSKSLLVIGKASDKIAKENKRSILHPQQILIYDEGENIFITGGNQWGVIYAVYAFLQNFCQCRMYSSTEKFIPRVSTLTVPAHLLLNESPANLFRDYYYTATVNDEYRDWHRLQQHFPKKGSSWGMWVHTFQKLLSDSSYFDLHPEYFSFYGSCRQPAQLCLSNSNVFKIVVENLKVQIAAKPEAKYWSVSQNDNYGYCQCNQCAAIDSIEGSHSGSIIRFVNKVAAEFPDKIISTLAYQYSRSAPKVTKPLPNVNIMFCSIECDRSKPISADTSIGSFAHDFKNWSALTSNILIWDYVVQFSNYISPFPNLKVLQPNIQFFHQYGVTDIFEQGSSYNWSDFGELKAYMISALLWNPYIDIDSLEKEFIKGYYGKAGPIIYKYLKTIEDNLQVSGAFLDIYGNPVTPMKSWLKPEHVDNYMDMLLEANKMVSDDSITAYRVQRITMPVWYAKLEQAKFFGSGERGVFERDEQGAWMIRPAFEERVSEFIATLHKHGITSLNENNHTPEKYNNDWQRILKTGMRDHIAMNKIVQFEIPFSAKYPAKGAATLTDGVGGYDDYHYNWLGWEGTDMIATIDLGEVRSIASLSCDFMEDQKSWIFFPESVQYYYSIDGKNIFH